MSTTVQSQREFTGNRMLVCMCAFFGVIIAVNLGLTYFALSTDTGLVVKNSYVASQDFNTRQAAAREQERLGWALSVEAGDDVLIITALDAAGAPLTGAAMTGRIGRPVTDRQDRAVSFNEDEPGVYRLATTLSGGDWQLDVTATRPDGDRFRRIFRLTGGR